MRTRRSVLVVVVLTSAALAAEQRVRAPSPRATQFSPERLTRLDALLQRYVDENRVAGASRWCFATASQPTSARRHRLRQR
jgi:hypothetical protein